MILLESGNIVEGRIALDGARPAGSILEVRLVSAGLGGRNAVARDNTGTEYLLPAGAPQVCEGETLNIEITREQIPGIEPWKRPLARASGIAAQAGPDLANARTVHFPSPTGEFAGAGWDDLLDHARTGVVRFDGGELRIAATPAMTLIDVDGWLPPDELALAGAVAAAKAIRRLDIGGSIGIDLPTVSGKGPRLEAGAAISEHLPTPFERTAVNGFGFVQVVRPRARASLIEIAAERPSFEARSLLRRAALEPPGAKRLVCHPQVAHVLDKRPDWLQALARQLGGAVCLRPDPALPMSGGYAEKC